MLLRQENVRFRSTITECVQGRGFQGRDIGIIRTKLSEIMNPLISVIIPNKDHIDDLKRCMDSFEKNSTSK